MQAIIGKALRLTSIVTYALGLLVFGEERDRGYARI
jgi:hypothetical protein